MKTLETIQKISKAGKIIMQIGFVCCIVGTVLGACGIVSIAAFPDSFKLGGMTVHGLIEQSSDVSEGTVYAELASAIVYCIGYAILCKTAKTYFENELAAGTPFTQAGAKELNTLGILTICIPLAVGFGSDIVYQIMHRFFSEVAENTVDNYSSVALGLVIIVVGLLCRYGAEMQSDNKEKTDENIGA